MKKEQELRENELLDLYRIQLEISEDPKLQKKEKEQLKSYKGVNIEDTLYHILQTILDAVQNTL